MQEHSGSQNLRIATFSGLNTHGVPEDTQDMRNIMRTVITFASKRNQLSCEALIRLEGAG
jgi:hypothetical protein